MNNKRPFIIAEAGVNHNGSLSLAKKLVDAAAVAGADAVKFQTFRAEEIVTRAAAKAHYQTVNTGTRETQFEMLKKLELSYADHKELVRYCRIKGIQFLSTPFDGASADMLESLGMRIFKIPSGELDNKPLIEHIARKGLPLILSTGMAYLGEIDETLRWIEAAGKRARRRPAEYAPVTLLHCVSDYPARPSEINLRAMDAMASAFKVPVGYSDHSLGIAIPVAAAARGAVMIEKHFTLDRSLRGPDHKASLEPAELKAMVEAIISVCDALGDGRKRPTRSELKTREIARRSIVASRRIKKGTRITSADITQKRPAGGIPPRHSKYFVGKISTRDYSPDELIEWQ